MWYMGGVSSIQVANFHTTMHDRNSMVLNISSLWFNLLCMLWFVYGVNIYSVFGKLLRMDITTGSSLITIRL